MSMSVSAAQKIMEANIAANMAALHQAQQRAHEQRRIDFQESYAGAVPSHGKFLVNGPGEADKTISFPVVYSQVPVVTFGFEIQGPDNLVWTRFDDQGNPQLDSDFPARPGGAAAGLVPGEAPIITAVVTDWVPDETQLPMDQKIIGAEVTTVCDGPENTKFIVHWYAAGIAYSNPSTGGMAVSTGDRVEGIVRLQVQWRPGQAGFWNGEWYRADETPPGYDGPGSGSGEGRVVRPQVQWRPGQSGFWDGVWYRGDQTPPGYPG